MAKPCVARDLRAFLAERGVPSTLRTGPHAKILFEVNGHKLMYVCSRGAPSDRRGIANARADLRRMLRSAGLETP